MNTENQSPWGPVIYAYTRSQAVTDGVQVEVTKTAKEVGISFPVFLTRAVFDAYVAVPPGVECQDEAGRLFDIVWMLRFAIQRIHRACDRVDAKIEAQAMNNSLKPQQPGGGPVVPKTHRAFFPKSGHHPQP